MPSDIAADRLARAASELQIDQIAHPYDSADLVKILDAIDVVGKLLCAFKPQGIRLFDAVGDATDKIGELRTALMMAGERDLQEVIDHAG